MAKNYIGTYRNLRIEGDFIIGTGYEGDEQVGYSLEAYQELEQLSLQTVEKLEEYEQLLIQNNLIEVPKTQEEINADLSEQLSKSLAISAKLAEQVEQLSMKITNMAGEVVYEHSGHNERKAVTKARSKTANNPTHKESV